MDIKFIEWELGGQILFEASPGSGQELKVAVFYGEVFKKIYLVQTPSDKVGEWDVFGSDTTKDVGFEDDQEAFQMTCMTFPNIQDFGPLFEEGAAVRILKELVQTYWQGYCRGRNRGSKDKAEEIAKVLGI